MIDDMTLHGLKPKTIGGLRSLRRPLRAVLRQVAHPWERLRSGPICFTSPKSMFPASTYNQYLCALKFLYRITPGMGLDGLARQRRQTVAGRLVLDESLASYRPSPASGTGRSS